MREEFGLSATEEINSPEWLYEVLKFGMSWAAEKQVATKLSKIDSKP